MNKQTINKGFMIAASILGLGILSYLFFRKKEEVVEEAKFMIVQEPKPAPQNKKPVVTAVIKKIKPDKKKEKESVEKTGIASRLNDDFPLKLGSKGERVKQLQVYLLRKHGSLGIVTENFNKNIEERVEKYLKVKTVSETLFNKLIHGRLKK